MHLKLKKMLLSGKLLPKFSSDMRNIGGCPKTYGCYRIPQVHLDVAELFSTTIFFISNEYLLQNKELTNIKKVRNIEQQKAVAITYNKIRL